MEIRIIPYQAWQHFDHIFRDEFDSDLPKEGNATFYGVFDKGEIKGFLLAEDIRLFGQIFMFEPKKVKYALTLIKHVRDNTPNEKAVATIASDERFGHLFETLGMQKIDGDFYRRG